MAVVIILLQMLTSLAVFSWATIDYLHGNKGLISDFTYRILFNFFVLLEVIGCSSDYLIAFKYLKSGLAIERPQLLRITTIIEVVILAAFICSSLVL